MTSFYAYMPNGEIVMAGECPDSVLPLQQFPGATIAEGFVQIGQNYRNDDGQICNIPSSPGIGYKFDYSAKQWVLDVNVLDENARSTRAKLLVNSDWTQIPNGPLTIEVQQEWASYRQQLRDVTEQSGYPVNIIWPTPPQE